MVGLVRLTAAFQFAEAFILPLLATAAPAFVEGFVRIPTGSSPASGRAHLRQAAAE
jgi:hypothetical protein